MRLGSYGVPICLGAYWRAVGNKEKDCLYLREDSDPMHWMSYFVAPKEEQKDCEGLEKGTSLRHRWWAALFALRDTAEMG